MDEWGFAVEGVHKVPDTYIDILLQQAMGGIFLLVWLSELRMLNVSLPYCCDEFRSRNILMTRISRGMTTLRTETAPTPRVTVTVMVMAMVMAMVTVTVTDRAITGVVSGMETVNPCQQ